MNSRLFAGRVLMLTVLLAAIPMSGCATIYRADAIDGQVADAETGKPLEGVIIVAHWEIQHPINGRGIEQLRIFETVTDQNGRYSFPAWGPKLVVSAGYLESKSPRIFLFKSGYKSGGFSNLYAENEGTTKFFYNGQTLKLEPFKGTLKEYAESLSSLSTSLWITGYEVGHASGDYCGWKSFPRMLRSLDKLEAEFSAAGVTQGTVVDSLKSNDRKLKERGCGSIYELLGVQK